MTLESTPFLRYVIAGKLQRDHIITIDGKSVQDIPGGGLIYAAAGLSLWEKSIGLIGRVGEDYPQDWIDQFSQRGFDIRGIRILPQAIDLRYFAAYPDCETRIVNNPISQFARLGLPYPRTLLGFEDREFQPDSRTLPTHTTLRTNNYPNDYLDATAAHLAPLDFLSHALLPSALRQGHVTTITLDPAVGYMMPTFWDDIPAILQGVTAFECSEVKIRSLFYSRSSDLWEMAETLADFGCPIIVIKRGSRGQMLYDRPSRKRYIIPAYPSKVVDPTGAGDAFCGGFLAGYRLSYDPLEATLYGNISASLTVEGSGPFYLLGTMPSLPYRRLESLRDAVQTA